MREIKFRAWDEIAKQMAMVQCLTQKWNGGYVIETTGTGTFIGTRNEKDSALMQYTGLKDKNGIEIYEGDIVDMPYNRYPQNWEVKELSAYGLNFQRITIKPFSAPHHYRDLRHTDQMEVIGNIYENPKLLEEIKK